MPEPLDLSAFAARHLADKAAHERDDVVVLAWTRPAEVNGMFMDSITAILIHDTMTSTQRGQGRHIIRPNGGTIALKSGPRIAEARSQLVDEFVTADAHKHADWLLMIDTDMNLPYDLVPNLLANAHPETAPIVGALCFAGTPYGRQFPTVYRAYNEDDGHLAIEPVTELPSPLEGLVKVGATGAACLLVHRQVYIAMLNRFGTLPDGRPNPYPWFSEGLTTSKGIPLGEDIAFCRKAMLMGIPIHVDLGVQIGHMKEGELTVDTFEQYRRSVAEPGVEQ